MWGFSRKHNPEMLVVEGVGCGVNLFRREKNPKKNSGRLIFLNTLIVDHPNLQPSQKLPLDVTTALLMTTMLLNVFNFKKTNFHLISRSTPACKVRQFQNTWFCAFDS